jgi:hypothetical protein
MKTFSVSILCSAILAAFALSLGAEEAPPPPTESPAANNAPTVAVLLPERIDQEWFWYYFTGESAHIVQSIMEKALLDAGVVVLDVSSQPLTGSLDSILSPDQARALAQKMGAEYMIWGQAIADKKSDSMAYGVRVVRASATITAKLIRVSDGRVMASEEISAEEGGQALRAAGREALKKAAKTISRKMIQAVQQMPGTAP